jgi:hypothetical protein
MVQMVVEMGLCDWDGLRGILGRLLILDAPCHHAAAILTAFARSACSSPAPAQPSPSPRRNPHCLLRGLRR